MNDSKHWANMIENDLRDDQSLAEQDRVLKSFVEQIQAEVFSECAEIAKSQIGAAERNRKAKGFKLRFLSEAALESVRDEERGEKIASEEIAGHIKRRLDAILSSSVKAAQPPESLSGNNKVRCDTGVENK